MSTFRTVILNQAQLEACCAWWQRVLRLQDWTIVIKRVRFSACDRTLGAGGLAGQVSWNLEKKGAVIKIVDPEDYDATCNPDFERPQDMEYTVVHELLHLHFAPLSHVTDGKLECRFEEQAVHAIALGLVSLERWPGRHNTTEPTIDISPAH